MTKLSTILAVSVLLGLAGGPALAQSVTKTWVSSTTGNDTGTCAFTSPCKTFAYAITQTLPGGEMDVKDGGSYGPVTITKAISIVSEGVLAAISVPQNGTGVTVNAGVNDNVILQGLVIDGHNTGSTGIVFTNGNVLTITDSYIRNVTLDGIRLQSGKRFIITNTDVTNAGGTGINIPSNSTFFNGVLSHVKVHGSPYGLFIYNSNTSVIDSVMTANTTGIYIGQQGNVLLGETTVAENSCSGVYVYNEGVLGSYGDNYINANSASTNCGDLTGPGTIETVQRR